MYLNGSVYLAATYVQTASAANILQFIIEKELKRKWRWTGHT